MAATRRESVRIASRSEVLTMAFEISGSALDSMAYTNNYFSLRRAETEINGRWPRVSRVREKVGCMASA